MKEKHTRIGNMAITAAILAATSGLSYLLHRVSNSDFHVPMLFVLAVLFISLLTDGYVYGIIASMAAVIGVNYIFTYPYFALNFTITGYPMTFLTMLAVSICVSALTTRIKKQEQIRLEVEKEKTRANLLRAISHDIRTPLTSIVGSASGILENQKVLTQEREMELVQDIKDEAQWLIRIVENLLSVTRINGENARINTEDEVVVEIAVEDDGQGIKESVLPVMFEGKISSDEEESDSKRNMGIGLSVCHSIVKAHKGGMHAENRAEGGARISFWLPMNEEDTDGY